MVEESKKSTGKTSPTENPPKSEPTSLEKLVEEVAAQVTLPPAIKDINLDPTKDDNALIAAWRRFLDYDRVSTDQKKQSIRIREYIIAIQLITSVIAILSSILILNGAPQTISDGIRLALIILPVISVGLMNYSSQFASSTAWIEYRVGAETIRQKIYEYRIGAGEFFRLDQRKAQERLLDVINKADQRIDEANATLPYMKPIDESKAIDKNKIKYRIRTKTEAAFDPNNPLKPFDDGLSALPVPDYIDNRVRSQIDWYSGRIERDYKDMRNYRLTALLIAGAGSVFAALGQNLESIVAITTALGVAYNARADTRMYGATYGIFHWTASKLRIELNKWDILSGEERKDHAVQARFVASMENIFRREQSLWRKSAIDSQQLIDRSLNSNLKSGAGKEMMAKLALKEDEVDEDDIDTPITTTGEELTVLVTGETPVVTLPPTLNGSNSEFEPLPITDDEDVEAPKG